MDETRLRLRSAVPLMVSCSARAYVDRRPIRPDIHARFLRIAQRAMETPVVVVTKARKMRWNGQVIG